MELKPGYKQTEVGAIPDDWKVVRLGDIGEALIGLTYKPSDVSEFGTLVLRSSNIQNDALSFDDNVFVDTEIPERILVREGDVLVCVRNGSRDLIGKSSHLDSRVVGMTFGAFMAVHRGPHGKLVSFLFQSNILKRQINAHLGATINQITNKSLNSFLIPLAPTTTESSAIATALGDLNSLLSAQDALIAKRRAVKQGAMQELLTGKRRLPGFDGEWEVKRIGEFCRCFSGGTPPTANPQYYGGEIAWITSSDLNSERIKSVDGRITREGLENSSAKLINSGTLLVALYGATAGVCAISEIEAAINQAVLAVIPTGADTEYLFQQLTYRKTAFISTYTQGGQPNLSGEIVKSFEIPMPAMKEEQAAIAELLRDMDTQIAALEARRDKVARLKQGMMQELLTGRTRLM